MVSQFEQQSVRRNRRPEATIAPEAIDHPICLQGVGLSQNGKPLGLRGSLQPTILKRTDQDFIAALLRELKSAASLPEFERLKDPPPTGDPAIAQSLANNRDAQRVLTLFQPVHRTFHVALLEVVCNLWDQPFLQPRLDPQKIESAGLVVRRIGRDGTLEGWRHKRYWDPIKNTWKTWRNWVPFDQPDDDLDPDPARRPPRLNVGNAEINRRLQTELFPLAESTTSLFVAPPDVCEAMGRTILFGVIPLTSPEVSEGDPIFLDPPDIETQDQLNQEIQQKLLPYYLRPAYLRPDRLPEAEVVDQSRTEPNANLSLTAETLKTCLNEKTPTTKQLWKQRSLRVFYNTLQQLKYHFRLLDTDPDSVLLLNLLNQIRVNVTPPQPQRLGDYLKKAIERLVDCQPGEAIILPQTWIAIDETLGRAIVSAIRRVLMKRLATLTAGEGRFEEQGRKYQIRAFVRVKRSDGCPPKLIWSDYSEPFTIVPWYASSDLPPVRVTLPDVLNPNTLATLQPDVSFAVPRRLFNFLQKNNPKDLLDGNGNDSNDNESGVDWICSFNIPIITLCAYIVLNIFLQLFNLIFQWLLLIKICIPVPKNLFPKKSVP